MRNGAEISGLPQAASAVPHPIAGFQAGDWLDTGLAFLLSGLFFVSLYGELPYHDAVRFAVQVDSGRFVWDIAHIFLQPVTLIWHRLLGFGESASDSQKHIHTFAVALGVAVFMATMIRLGVARWQRALGVVLLIASTSLIILTPSAHMKLVVFPFLNGAIYFAVRWEQARRAGLANGDRDLLIAAAFLAAATGLLASALAAAPFVTFAAIAVRIAAGGGWRDGLGSGFRFAALCGGLFLALACLGFVLFADQPLSAQGLAASVATKAEMGPQAMPLLVRLARSVYGTANNLIGAPVLGSTLRAWLGGEIADLRPYYATLAGQLAPWVLVLLLLAAIYGFAVRAAWRGAPCLMPLAFLAGAHAWSIVYSLNDPEHWFMLSVPTILLFLTIFPDGARSWLLPIATALVVVNNLRILALPTTLYPLARYQAEVARQFNERDLLISFAAYPGGPFLGFFALPGLDRLRLDRALGATPDPTTFYGPGDRRIDAAVDARIDAAIARGGRVVAFDVFDPGNWEAPWPNMTRIGLPKARLLAHFARRYRLVPLGRIAELKAWQVVPLVVGR